MVTGSHSAAAPAADTATEGAPAPPAFDPLEGAPETAGLTIPVPETEPWEALEEGLEVHFNLESGIEDGEGTVGDAGPEAGGAADEESEAAPAPPSLAGLSDEEIAALPEVRSLLARREEGLRRRAEAGRAQAAREAAAQIADERRRYVASEQFVRDFEDLAREAAGNLDANGRPQLNGERLRGMFSSLVANGAEGAAANMVSSVNAVLPEGTALTPEEQAAYATAWGALNANPHDIAPLQRVLVSVATRATLERAWEALREGVEQQVRAELQARAGTAAAQQRDEARRSQPGPTRDLRGSAPSHFRLDSSVGWTEYIHAAANEGEMASRREEFAEWLAKNPER